MTQEKRGAEILIQAGKLHDQISYDVKRRSMATQEATGAINITELKDVMRAQGQGGGCWGWLIPSDQQEALLAEMALEPRNKPFCVFMAERGYQPCRDGGTDEEAAKQLEAMRAAIEEWLG